jgi:hypothetical protein
MRRSALPLLASGLLLLVGCGESPGYDDAAVESYLVEGQSSLFGAAGDKATSTCPDDRELREGMTVTCTLTVSGAKLPYRVKLTNVHDEERVTVVARPDGVLVSGAKIRSYVRSTLPRTSAGADVDCGSPFVVVDVGATVECTLTLGSQEKPLEVKVLDTVGRVSIRS